MAISDNIYFLRNYLKLSQSEFGAMFGVSDKAVSTWEKGTREPRMGVIQKMADKFGLKKSDIIDADISTMFTSADSLANSTNIPPNMTPLKTKKLPLVGQIACGLPILAEENISRYVDVLDSVRADFCLECKGNSMTGARINDGDIVCIRLQPEVEPGQIAAVRIGEEATLKRVYYYPDKLVLQAENPAYPPQVYTDQDLEDIEIIGKAVAFVSWVK